MTQVGSPNSLVSRTSAKYHFFSVRPASPGFLGRQTFDGVNGYDEIMSDESEYPIR